MVFLQLLQSIMLTTILHLLVQSYRSLKSISIFQHLDLKITKRSSFKLDETVSSCKNMGLPATYTKYDARLMWRITISIVEQILKEHTSWKQSDQRKRYSLAECTETN